MLYLMESNPQFSVATTAVLESRSVKIRTVDDLQAVLDEEHWREHIVRHHPEMKDNFDLLVETLQNVRAVYRSKRDQETRIYFKEHASVTLASRLIEQMALLVYVRESNGFVVTAFFASAWPRSLGERIWPS